MGYETEITGSIYYGDTSKTKQQVIEKVVEVINLMQWYCTSSRRLDESIKYYTPDTKWMHFLWVGIDTETKNIDLNITRKDYNNATETFLYLIAPYLNTNKIFNVELQGAEDDDFQELQVTDGKVFVNGELFKTNNALSFPFPTIVKI